MNVITFVKVVYEKGIELNHSQVLFVTEESTTPQGSVQAEAMTLCLGDSDPHAGGLFLTTPLVHGLEDMSVFQRFSIGSFLGGYVPIQELSQLELDEITQMAVQQDNACIRLDISRFNIAP